MTANAPIPLRPHVSVGALIEAAEASGLDDEQIGRLLDRWFRETLVAVAPEPLVRRAVATTGPRPRLRLVDDEQDDEPAWPPAPIEGDPIPMPGFDVPARTEEGRPSWTA
jgi:hypothetical protein